MNQIKPDASGKFAPAENEGPLFSTKAGIQHLKGAVSLQLAGAAILGVGIWVKVDSASLLGILENLENGSSGISQLVNVSYVLMAVGGVLLVIGFLGCCGAIRESKCMLLTFFSIVLIIFLIEVAGAVVLFVFQGVKINGCYDTLVQLIEDNATIVAAVALGIAALEFWKFTA
ncbi:hypothetical protein INR49_029442 [Caranx melampygus]|nr:hypothetical protein INR49_029442 [Caranx melampygus]